VSVPVTVIYGGADSIVPPEQSRAVAEAAPRLHRVLQIPGLDHNDPTLLDGRELLDAVVELADRIDGAP
jgi:pimeloyl-ACP methyl ester carboxylesterase